MSIKDSTNILIELNNFTHVASGFKGGAVYFDNVTGTIKNSTLYHSYIITPTGVGGSMYFVNSNVNITGTSLEAYEASSKIGAGIYFDVGNYTADNNYFNGANALWINNGANVTLIKNNITGERPTKDKHYLEENYSAVDNAVNYAIWNNGNLSLENNTFDYVIFNNGTIWTPTTTWILDNATLNKTWNSTFTFYAHIVDDNNNTVISVHTLITWNDVRTSDPPYPMAYNALPNTRLAYQGNFTIFGNDTGLKKNDIRIGHINVKMPTTLSITHSKEYMENITFTVKISALVQSNYTFDTSKLHIKVFDTGRQIEIPTGNITYYGLGNKWDTVYANFTINHMKVGTFTITAEFEEDLFHEGSQNSTDLALFSRSFWIKVNASDIFYGQTLVINVSSNATNTENGRITISINGKIMSVPLHLHPDGSYIYEIPNENYTALLEPGSHIVSVIFQGGTYYGVQSNFSLFNVYSYSGPFSKRFKFLFDISHKEISLSNNSG